MIEIFQLVVEFFCPQVAKTINECSFKVYPQITLSTIICMYCTSESQHTTLCVQPLALSADTYLPSALYPPLQC